MFFSKQLRARHVEGPQERPACAGFMQRLTQSKSGNVSILFGLMIVPFVSFAGLSIDFATASREKSKIQSALDAAALAAGRAFQGSNGDEDEARAAAALYFYKQTGYELTVNTVDPGTFVLSVAAEEDVPTSFMGVLGSEYDTLTVQATSKAQLQLWHQTSSGEGDQIEVSMMLDVTGSMGGQRITDLKSAATDLVNIVVLDDVDAVRVALAPFSHAVNVGPYFNDMTDQDPINGNTCVVERTGAKFNDKTPTTANRRFKTLVEGKIEKNRTSSYWSCPTAEIVPLTSNKQLLLDEIDDLPTHGNTAGHLGTAWAWYLISKKWSNMFDDDRRNPANTTDGVKKIAVLMSDGQYNNNWFNDSNGDSDEQARKICNNMKKVDNGIEVYAVGFELSEGSDAYNRLKACATDDAHFFAAYDGDELKQAFRAIAFKISELRLVE